MSPPGASHAHSSRLANAQPSAPYRLPIPMLASLLPLAALAAVVACPATDPASPALSDVDLIVTVLDATGAPVRLSDEPSRWPAAIGARRQRSIPRLFVEDLRTRELLMGTRTDPVDPEPNIVAIRTTTGSTVGLAAWSETHGLTEAIVRVPADAESPIPVTLRFPAARATGTLRVEPDGGPERIDAEVHSLLIAAPRTGIVVAYVDGFVRSRQSDVVLPADRYLVEVDGRIPAMCGNGSPMTARFASSREVVDVAPDAITTARPRLRTGASLQPTIEVWGESESVEENADRSHEAAVGTIVPSGEPRDDEAWIAQIAVRRDGADDRGLHVRWGWDAMAYATPSQWIPCGRETYSIELLPPGEYVLTVSGPRIVTTEFPITVRADQRREPVTLRVEPRD